MASVAKEETQPGILGKIIKFPAAQNIQQPRFRTGVMDPKERLWFHSGFWPLLGSKIIGINHVPAATAQEYNLQRNCAGAELPEGRSLDATEGWARFLQLVSEQMNGGAGPLLNDGNNNWLIIGNSAFSILWHVAHGAWRLAAAPCSKAKFERGDRVFIFS